MTGGERRPELAQEREDDDARDVLDAAEALQAERELDGHDHPDEDRRDRDDAERAHAERLDLVDGRGGSRAGRRESDREVRPVSDADCPQVLDEAREAAVATARRA